MDDFTLEIKCQYMSRRHIELIVDGRMDKDYMVQTQFIKEMDAKLKRLGFRFGEQFKA